MGSMRKTSGLLLSVLLAASGIAGCGKSSEGGQEAVASATPQEQLKPVTLKMYQTQGYWTEADFNTLIAEPVKKKYPHITVEFDSKTSVDQAVTTGQPIDLVAVWNGLMPQYDDMGIFEDIYPLVKKFKMDLGRFDSGALDAVKKATKSGALYGLPNLIQFYALYYNKDIFDRFAVPYPKDGMTWDETIELAKKVTRNEGGTPYLGLDPDYLTRMLTPMSLGIIDGTTEKTDVNSEIYKKIFEMGKKIYDIPGNISKDGIMKGSVTDRFVKDKNTAMLATINLFDKLKDAPGLNWDVAQFPSYKERPNTYGAYDLHIMTISKTSEHKDDAMRVLEVFFSDEVQLQSARVGKYTAMKDQKFKQEYLKGVDAYKNIHIQNIFKSTPAPAAPPYSKSYSKARGILVTKFTEYAQGKKDVNTALREAEDEINAVIKAQQ